MATMEEVYAQVMASDEERTAFVAAAASEDGVTSFLAQHGCDASAEDVAAFLRSKTGELDDAELDGVAGGCDDETIGRAFVSVFTFSIFCQPKA